MAGVQVASSGARIDSGGKEGKQGKYRGGEGRFMERLDDISSNASFRRPLRSMNVVGNPGSFEGGAGDFTGCVRTREKKHRGDQKTEGEWEQNGGKWQKKLGNRPRCKCRQPVAVRPSRRQKTKGGKWGSRERRKDEKTNR